VSLTRRALLGAPALVWLAAGCRPRGHLTGLASADRTVLRAAIDAEEGLLASYDAAIARLDAVAAGSLTRARDRHQEHLRALTATSTPRETTSPAPARTPTGDVNDVLATSVVTLQRSGVSARSGEVAALLASIAAEHAADAAPGPSE